MDVLAGPERSMDSGALRRLVLATKREVDMSERNLLFLMTAEQADAFARLVAAAGSGDGDAACRLGDMYREGLGGLRYSPKETYRWYAKSALAGDANGQNNLGACYEHGVGCAQSFAKAVKWYRLSAAQKLGTASMNLGYCYLRGHGVPRDEVEALRLFRLAVEGGEERAAQEVERLEMSRGPRGLQLAPEDTPVAAMSDGCSASPASTQQARPCVLALGSLPRDGSPERLQPPDTAQAPTVKGTWPSEDSVSEPLNVARPPTIARPGAALGWGHGPAPPGSGGDSHHRRVRGRPPRRPGHPGDGRAVDGGGGRRRRPRLPRLPGGRLGGGVREADRLDRRVP